MRSIHKSLAYDSEVRGHKLHGDFLYNSIKNVGNEVAKLDRNMEEKFQKTCEDLGLIVIGYGGQDETTMSVLRSMVAGDKYLKGGLHWCIYERELSVQHRLQDAGVSSGRTSGNLDSVPVPEEVHRMWERHRDKVHLYVVPGFDEVMEAIFVRCACRGPVELTHPQEKAAYIRLRDSLEATGQRIYVTRGFNELMHQFQAAHNRPISRSQREIDEADFWHQSGRLEQRYVSLESGGAAERVASTPAAKKRLETAKVCFDKAVIHAENALQADDAGPEAQVHGYRRLSGSEGSWAECEFKIAGKVTQSFEDIVFKSWLHAVAGLKVDLAQITPEVASDLDNLHFNVLSATQYRCKSGHVLTEAEWDTALSSYQHVHALKPWGIVWLEELSSDIGWPEFQAAKSSELQRRSGASKKGASAQEREPAPPRNRALK